MVNGVAHRSVRGAGAFGSHVAFRGKAGHQIVTGRKRSEYRALGDRLLDSLQVFGAGMKEEVDVRIDHPGHKCRVAKVDHQRAGGMRTEVPASRMRSPSTRTSPG